MTQERMDEIAEQLEGKADAVDDGFYGKEDDDECWAADLRRAATRLRKGLVEELNHTDLEEIECCADADADEMEELRHPNTDVHRAGCPSCQYAYDCKLPNAGEELTHKNYTTKALQANGVDVKLRLPESLTPAMGLKPGWFVKEPGKKSGAEYLAQHPGWKTRKARKRTPTRGDLLRSAASAVEHGRHATAKKKIIEAVADYLSLADLDELIERGQS